MKIKTIKKRGDFINIQKQPKIVYHGETLIVLLKETEKQYITNEEEFFRFGITITKKTNKLAVMRNKAKRQIREIIRNIAKKSCNLFINHSDYEIVIKKDFFNYSFKDKFNDLENILLRLKIKYEQQ